MRIHFDLSALHKSSWHEYVLRFLFGGVVTTAAGIMAKHFGPVIGGLFLAFPAIFPASVTLVAKHEEEKKREAGIPGTQRGRMVAALEARGAAIGSIGLVCFAVLVWKLLPVWNAFLTISLATSIWILVSTLIWLIKQKN